MTDYLTFADAKTIIISLATGIIGGLIVLGITRYWSNHTIASVKRRIEYAEARKGQLENLAKSERTALLFGLGALFAVIGVMNFILAIEILPSRDAASDIPNVARALLWFIPGLLAFYFAHVFQQIEKYPDSIKAIEKKLTKLKSKLRGSK
jgi:hypothetical protein